MLTEVVQEKPVGYGPPDYDSLWKKIIGELFQEFMLFFAPDLYEEIDFSKVPDFLQQELFKEVIQGKKGKNIADQIVKVQLKNGEDKWVLIHIEVQDEDNKVFSKRMFRYFYRIYDKFDKEVYAIALMTDNKKTSHPSYFHYSFFGTTVDYTYNVYKFHEHSIEELEQSNNPFAAAIIAGKYTKRYKRDFEQRFHFKIKLMEQIFKKFPLHDDETRIYFDALFYFIDYILQTPIEYEQEFREEIRELMEKDGVEQMHVEKEKLSPTFIAVLKMIEQDEIVKAKEKGIEEGNKEAKVNVAVELIKDGFQDEKIAQLTKLALQEVIELRKSL